MSEMVQKVAAALFDAMDDLGEFDCLALQGGRLHLDGSVPQDDLARALISAMREPGQEIIARALHEIEAQRGGQRESVQTFREFYRAMIGAMLNREVYWGPDVGREEL